MSHSNQTHQILNGIILNIYPDSMGDRLSYMISLLEQEDFEDLFSCLYVLPSLFHSDLDRGFSVIDYNLNQEIVQPEDLERLKELGVSLKLDMVVNHLSVNSPEFKNLMQNGDDSPYLNFFINWNKFWTEEGLMGCSGVIDPKQEHKQKLFLRKPGLPILQVPFPDNSFRPYWNTFYQKILLSEEFIEDCKKECNFSHEESCELYEKINESLNKGKDPSPLTIRYGQSTDKLNNLIRHHLKLHGQMDLDASFVGVWDYYEKTLNQLKSYGAKIVRLDAFAYLHKKVGSSNFFNIPGTWHYLDRLKSYAAKLKIILLPEIHAQYGKHIHKQLSDNGFPIYDFFLPGLIIHTLEEKDRGPLLKWIEEIQARDFRLINMLGCHDGIPLLDLDRDPEHIDHPGLLSSSQIESLIDKIILRGGYVKNLFGPDGHKISYYQVNSTYFSALNECQNKLLMARAIQLFMPGTPQIWYLDLFAGVNDHGALEANTENHKEINRTNLSAYEVQKRLKTTVVQKQLDLLRLRAHHPAFKGSMKIVPTNNNLIQMRWENGHEWAMLKIDLSKMSYSIDHV